MVALETRIVRCLLAIAVAAASVVLPGAPSNAAPKKFERMPVPLDCPWGFTQQHTCVNSRLAWDVQRSGLVYSQQFQNRNFSPYTSANQGVERQYPVPSIEWWSLRINTNF
jgi:hypothetical protein